MTPIFNSPTINHHFCLACGACVGVCPFNALILVNLRLEINTTACEGCGFCVKTCPVDALAFPDSRQSVRVV